MISPLGTKVLLELLPAEEKTKGGLLIPQSGRKKINKAIILELGPDIPDDTLLCKGDIVIYENYAGTLINKDDKTLVILELSDVVAIVEEDEGEEAEEVEENE